LKVKLANLHVSHCHDCSGFAIWVGGRLLFPIDVEKMSAPLAEEDFEEVCRDFE
jgi:hypothetical protein